MAADINKLAESIKSRNAILFVGAGVSMSVGLPSWQELITHMIEELDLPLETSTASDFTYQTLAEFYRLRVGSIGPLRSWMDGNWQIAKKVVKESLLHQLIVELDFPIIYTTNYDRNLEVAFEIYNRPYEKVTNAKDIAKANLATTQIVKFHGDFDDDASLVLAETDYLDRLTFASPVDIKFRADALGRTILFIGYSMTDVNIRLLLHRLWQTWTHSGYEKDRPRSFVFMPSPNVIQEAVLGKWGITLLHEQAASPEEALTAFLSGLYEKVRQN